MIPKYSILISMKTFVIFLEKYENSSKCAVYLIAPFLS